MKEEITIIFNQERIIKGRIDELEPSALSRVLIADCLKNGLLPLKKSVQFGTKKIEHAEIVEPEVFNYASCLCAKVGGEAEKMYNEINRI